jgi:hypothetical protein
MKSGPQRTVYISQSRYSIFVKDPIMPTPTNIKNVIQYTLLAAATTKNIAEADKVPLLGSTAALALSILNCIEVS